MLQWLRWTRRDGRSGRIGPYPRAVAIASLAELVRAEPRTRFSIEPARR